MMEKSSSVEADGEMLITVVGADEADSLLNPMKASPGSILMTLMAASSPFCLFRA